MAEDQDDSQKTEEPTQKRLDESLKKGQVAFSKEVSNFLLLLMFTLLLGMNIPGMTKDVTLYLSQYIEFSHEFFIEKDSGNVYGLMKRLVQDIGMLVALPFMALLVTALLSALLQNGIVLSVDPIIPKLEKISVFKGIKRLFSLKSVMEFVKGIVKISIVGVVALIAVWPDLGMLKSMHDYTILALMEFILDLSIRLLIGVCVVMAVIAALDYMYQKFEYLKSLRMSKQDIKDEYKQSEGNPEVKAKLRAIRQERAQRRMMSAIPDADVVITNPTHFAVALQYEMGVHNAPIVVAKGQDFLALKIQEIAREHDVAIVSNPPLARALFASSEIDEEVPLEHYNAVAEVIGYVYRMKGKIPA